jgi:hypothetical protein
MKYSEVITLDENFQPVFDLTNESGSYWERFIPNIKFYDVLRITLNSLESSEPKESQSLWMQGTYGTGKSHATSVVKHLLSDPVEDFRDFINKFEDKQLSQRLLHFRESNKICPVVLRGTSMITDSRTFSFAIQVAIKKAVPGIVIEDDFETMIKQIEVNPMHMDWKENIESSELRPYVRSPQDLVKKLKDLDQDILIKLQEVVSKNGAHFSTSNLTEWLKQAVSEIKAKQNVSALMIFWDEFTPVLEMPNSGVLLSEIQNIAELSRDKDIYLFVITHRTPAQANLKSEDVEKVLDRFKRLDYAMEPITTYHIMNASLKKLNEKLWYQLKNENIVKIDNAIKRILVGKGEYANEGANRKQIENLFPIHPYTAHLLTFIARNIGSTDRSIFNFLFDDKSGFKYFINKNPGIGGETFLTADILWDFFYPEFERMNDDKMSSSLERYKLYREIVEKEGGKEASKTFKAILLLNILYKFTDLDETSLLAPSEDNIRSAFLGTGLDDSIDRILGFFDKRQIFNKNVNDLYIVTSAIPPQKEVEATKEELKERHKDITSVLTEYDREELKKTIHKEVLREIEVSFLDSKDSESLLENKLVKAFKTDSSIHIAVLMSIDDQEILKAKGTIKNLTQKEEFKNIVFVLLETPLGKQTFEKYIDYRARAQVAEMHNHSDDRKGYEENASKVINDWVNKSKSGYISWYLKDKEQQTSLTIFSRDVNETISKIIFSFGLENIKLCRNNINIWKPQQSKKAVEIFLFASARSDVEETATGLYGYLKGVIQGDDGDYVVDPNLNFKQGVNKDHPLKKMSIETEEAIEKNKSKGDFNLGQELEFLKKPPFGLYQNIVSMGTLAFLMRQYTDKLYEIGTGIPIGKENMREKVLSVFKFWENGNDRLKLQVRFGTNEEKSLIETLKDVFDIDDPKSLNDVKWKIRERIKKNSFPLWVYCKNEQVSDKVKNAIKSIIQFIETVDQDTTQDKINEYLSAIQDVTIDLKEILKRDEEDVLFKSWIKKVVPTIQLNEESFKELMGYLERNMQEEVALWNEDKVKDKAKDWGLEKTAAPTIVIKYPSDNSFIEGSTTITGMTEPNVKITINDEPVDVSSNGTFSFDVTVSEPTVFTIIARNEAGKVTKQDLYLSPKQDQTPPPLTVEKKKDIIDRVKRLNDKRAKEILLKLAEDDDIAIKLEQELDN